MSDDPFGLIQPSLIQQIKKILDEYPDDGQILKELIQNAEDAGATEVKILIDHHSYSTENLHNPDLVVFQGPALYAHNNATFTKNDWKGIGMLCDSIKVKDPTKVGRFGLGFKSVFHMTDLPSVVSGDSIGMIDPHEQYFSNDNGKRSGMRWKLDNPITSNDEFAPYKNVFDCKEDVFEKGNYKGTLFRLPFRQQPSKLSNTVYSDRKKMQGLFESFKSDAHLILVFLMNLERIEIYERKADKEEAEILFSVGISEDCKAKVQQERKAFSLKVNEMPVGDIKQTFIMNIDITDWKSGDTQKHSFVVTHFLSGCNLSTKMENLVKDESLSYMPRVGVAFPLKETEIENIQDDPQGHVFCFLPLPVESKSLTGLPVHINGFFALSQNRRYLKWRSADQNCSTDKSLDWNEGLLSEVLPKAYAELISFLVIVGKSHKVVYSAWPNINAVDIKWKIILEPLFRLMLASNELLYSEAHGGRWCNVKDVIFDVFTDSDSARHTVVKLLNEAGYKIVTVPHHVRSALNSYITYHFTEITPRLLRESLKRQKGQNRYTNLPREEKLSLLKYSLEDSKFGELDGLHLLPLSAKYFTQFQTTCPNHVYIDSPEHPQTLLPGMQAMFLDPDIDLSTLNSLKRAVEKGFTQLRHFDKDAVKKHLREALPKDWIGSEEQVVWNPGHSQHPPLQWLDDFWRYACKEFINPSDLDAFLGIPLIQIEPITHEAMKLAKIHKPSTLLLASLNCDQLEDSVKKIVRDFGVILLTSISSHHSLVPGYINPPSPKGVLTALSTVASKNSQPLSNDVRPLRILFSQLSTPTESERMFLKTLKLFDACSHPDKSPRPVSLLEVPLVAPVSDLPPVRCFTDMIYAHDNHSRMLIQLLGAAPMSESDLVTIMLKDAKGGMYTIKEVDDLVKYILDRFSLFSDVNIKHHLADLPFVTSSNGVKVKPGEVFDPQDGNLVRMFLDESGKFPKADSVYSNPSMLFHLKDLGLKSRANVSADDILNSAKLVVKISNVQRAKEKSTALLTHLQEHPVLLLLSNQLSFIEWVPIVVDSPINYYPNAALLTDSKLFTRPGEVTCVSYRNLVGSVKHLVDASSTPNIAAHFGWNQKPSIGDVTTHFANIISCYREDEKTSFVIIIKDIYRYLAHQNVCDVLKELQQQQIHQWIWNGQGFSSTSQLVQYNELLDLKPYLYPLPMDMNEFATFFIKCGMKQEQDSNSLLEVLRSIKDNHERLGPRSHNEVKRDLRYCTEVLDALKPKDGEELDSKLREKLLMPLDVEADTTLKLALVDECTYCDREWLKQGHDVDEIDDADDIKIKFIHRNISNTTAELFNVPTLMSRILDADELDMGESFGQSESLLDRLKSLLDGYTDGLSVPKELIQNADDAGATEVRFLYDERTNDNAMTNLIDEGMKACQGSALWSYNNAVFTDEDFQNVVKLNAATKEGNTEKIGRFGLGFNSVYNLTDVPSFVSRESIVILDPHLTYLGKAIRDKSKPGIKINTKQKKFRRLHNQFKPYNGIFGCDFSPGNRQESYNGTLFRFPLRTSSQAEKSKIKKLCYDDNQVKELLQMLLIGSESLLLYTQNILRVSVYHLTRDQEPSCPKELFSISKSCENVIHRLQCEISLSPLVQELDDSGQELVKQSSILRASSLLLQGLSSPSSNVLMRSSMVLRSCRTLSDHGKEFLNERFPEQKSVDENFWLVYSCMVGVTNLSQHIKGILPVAGVAARLKDVSAGKRIPSSLIQASEVQMSSMESLHYEGGNIFCFLPLPIHSGLPVHINGCFAVDDSRRHLRELTEDDKSDHGARWNKVLMTDVVLQAFLGLLEDAKETYLGGDYSFHSLWPCISNVKPLCHDFLRSFYHALCSNNLELFSDGKRWSSFDNVAFLEPSLQNNEDIGQTAFDVLKAVLPQSQLVIDMPQTVLDAMKFSRLESAMQKLCYDKYRFFREVVFPQLHNIDERQRNVLVLYALDDPSEILQSLVQGHCCIPSSPSGHPLKRPKDLIHPSGRAAKLYEPEDGRFPCGEAFTTDERLLKLKHLGMREDDLEWEDIMDRAQSVQNLDDYNQALGRTRIILQFGEMLLKKYPDDSYKFKEGLQQVPFLPILQKPTHFPFGWKGVEYQHKHFLPAIELYPKCWKYLVSSIKPILDDKECQISDALSDFLRIQKPVSLDQAKAQLHDVINTKEAMGNDIDNGEVEKACKSLYSYFQRCLSGRGEELREFLSTRKFVLVDSHFLFSSQIAFHTKSYLRFPPYLSIMPSQWVPFSDLFCQVGVRESFDIFDYVDTLRKIEENQGGKAIDDDLLSKVVVVIELLATTMEIRNVPLNEVEKEHGKIFLPDVGGIMKPAGDMCIKDCIWMPDEDGITYASDKILWKISLALGVKTRRQETISRFAIGMPFGQKEKLTNRLKRILTGYPCDGTIMKELLQNADDAKASKICFIKDPRHHPSERVFEDSWKALQGPALCVYNDAPFTNNDIKGIQNLGEGSKGDDPNKTGQYGVGFNAVYHLTDVPSFLSKGEEIGEVMCAFDPNLRYVPCATAENPGIKIDKLDTLRKTFVDVWPCYLEQHFPINNGTMFRFPLRNVKMAEKSKIKLEAVTFESLSSLVDDFQKDLLESLLFVNKVKEISIHEIDKENGEITMTYQAKAQISQDDETKRQEFSSYVKTIGSELREGKISFNEIPVRKVSYVLHLSDSNGISQEWLVVKQIGCESHRDIPLPECVDSAFKRGDLGLLPRGGVASLIKSSIQRSPSRAFCFLPLPFKTGLPVHVNGHFALEHEARRSIWRSETDDYRSKWNKILIQQVVAPCYVFTLEKIREFINLPLKNGNKTILQETRQGAEKFLENYTTFFPSVNEMEFYWKILAKEVYFLLSARGINVLPVLRSVLMKDSHINNEVAIEWLSPAGEGNLKAFFDNMKPSEVNSEAKEKEKEQRKKKLNEYFVLRDTFLAVGFNLLCMPMSLYNCFVESDVQVHQIFPEDVTSFLHTYGSPGMLTRNIGVLPLSIAKTPFKDNCTLCMVLKYCAKGANFYQELNGLPLLLTEDSKLRVFDKSDPVFLTGFRDLVPACHHMFVHHILHNSVFHDQNMKEMPPEFKTFNVLAFSKLLPGVLDQERYSLSHITWNPGDKKEHLPNDRWICCVWTFFDSMLRPSLKKLDECSNKRLRERTLELHQRREFAAQEEKRLLTEKKQLIQKFLEPVETWCLLPVTEVYEDPKTGLIMQTHFLVRIDMAENVLVSYFTENQALTSAVEKLSLQVLNCRVLSGSEYLSSPRNLEIPKMLIASLKDLGSFLVVLIHKFKVDPSIFFRLQGIYREAILQHFNKYIQDFQYIHACGLKSLPLFPAINGDHISIQSKQALVLSSRIPQDEMNKWEASSGIVFLRENYFFKELYTFLGCDAKNEVDVYCDVIFNNFHDMSKGARLTHITFVRQLLVELENGVRLITKGEKERQRVQKEKLLNSLQYLKFDLAKDGSLKQASCFYDPEVTVFKVMLPDECFPTEPFCNSEWLPFLRKIGLVHIVTDELVVRFAKDIEIEGKINPTLETKDKSEILVAHLFKMENIATSRLLDDVKDFSFIAHHQVDDKLKAIHDQFCKSKYICFVESVDSRKTDICWTSANILPTYANPHLQPWYAFNPKYENRNDLNNVRNYQQQIVRRLNILQSPSCEMVVNHCANVCSQLSKRDDTQKQDETRNNVVTDVMVRIYTFLQENINSGTHVIKNCLENIQCIVVEDGKCFVYPKQIVADLMNDDQIPPYLYKVPPRLAAFIDLFKSLGTTDTVTASQYAMVLEYIYLECKTAKLDPNETKKAFKATKGLFETIVKKGTCDLKQLYLPALSRNPTEPSLTSVFLRKSSDIFLNDAPHFKDRLDGFQEFLLVKLKECDLIVDNDDRVINKLPEPLRPCMLTSVVHEALVAGNELETISNAAQSLKTILRSSEFCFGLIRLVRHAEYEQDKRSNDNIVSDIKKSLNFINVYSVKGLRTQLVYKDSIIPESEAQVACFEECTNKGVWNIYVEHLNDVEAYISRVAEIIDRITGHLLGKSLVHLPVMLLSPLEKISALLDSLKIREDNSYLKDCSSIFPNAGQFIHVEDHHLLEYNFTLFDPGEYVGYELDDPSLRGEDGTPTYIYAIIVEKLASEEYKIDIGDEYIVVNADKLYKFYRRKQEGEGMELELFTGAEESKQVKPEDLDEAKRQVRQTLEKAWLLPEERKRRIIKRLYLTWHPDKNPGNEKFCTEVFKFLQSEIERLEKGLQPDDTRGFNTNSYHYSSRGYYGSYGDFFNRWSGYATNHKRYRSSYSDRGGRPSYHRSNPQPGEAARWYRQASQDHEAASNDLREPKASYEWACFKCHQSAEKALKAGQYSIDADKTSTHSLPDIASCLGNSELLSLAWSLESLLGSSTRMRYPDRVHFPSIPHDIYTKEMAVEAVDKAGQILAIVKNKFVH